MPVSREEKEELIAALVADLKKAQAVIITDYRGLPTADLANLRNQLRGMQASYHIAKNTLVALALSRAGMPVPDKLLEGPTALAFLEKDIAGPAKALNAFFKDKGLPVKGAIVGQQVYDPKGIEALITLPSREQLFAAVLGSLNAPGARTVGVIASGIRQVLYVLKARAEQLEKQARGA